MALIDLTGVDKFIDDLSNTDPKDSDYANILGQYLQGIQNVLLNQFPNLTGAVSPTQTELNHMVGQDQGVATTDDVEFNGLDHSKETWSVIASADSPYSASVGENIFCQCDGAITINLPAPGAAGERLRIRTDHQCTSTNDVTLDPDGANTVAGETTVEVDLPFFDGNLVADSSDDWSF